MIDEPIPVKFSRIGAEELCLSTGELRRAYDVNKGDCIQLTPEITATVSKVSGNSVKGNFITVYFEAIAVRKG